MINRLSNMLIFVMIVANLGVEEGGIYSLALAFFFIGSRIAFWGLDQLLTREVAKDHSKTGQYLSNFLYARVILALLAIAIFYLIVQLSHYDSETKLVISLMLLSILPENINNLCWGGFAAFEEYHLTGIGTVLNMGIKLGLGFIFIRMGMPLAYVALAVLLGHIGSMLVNLFITRRRYLMEGWQRADPQFIWRQLRYAIPFLFIGIFFIFDSRLDVILLSALSSETAVGLYGAATAVIMAFTILPEGYRIAVLPVMSRFQEDKSSRLRDLYERSFKYLLIIAIPISIAIILLAEDLISLIYRKDLPEAVSALRVLAIGLTFTFLIVVNNRLLIVHNRQDLIARILILSTAANVLVNVLLIPNYGAVGAAVARTTSLLLLLFLTSWASSRLITGVRKFRFVWRPLISSVVMGLVIWQLSSLGFWIQSAAGAVVYLSLLLLMGAFSAQELRILRQLANTLRPGSS